MIIVAVVLAVIATCMINYSGYMQKRELDTLPLIGSQRPMETVKAFIKCRPWLEAQGLQFGGTFIKGIAVGLAPLSVVQPINTAGIALLAWLAITKLGEKPSWSDWLGIGTILAGLVMLGLSLFGVSTKAFSYNPWILWFFVVFFFAVAGFSLFNGFTKKHAQAPNLIATASGILIGLTAVLIKMAWNDIGARFWEHGFRNALLSPYLYLIILLPVITLVLDQIAMQRGKAIVVVPIITGMSNLIPIIIGIVAMHEPMPSSGGMFLVRILSFVFIVGGSIILSLRRSEDKEKKPHTPPAHPHLARFRRAQKPEVKEVGPEQPEATAPIDA
jgi:drug/metabolite transporter (DMT)-like permease